jgi:serine protease Do
LLFIFVILEVQASGVPGVAVKGGIPRLINMVVDVVVTDKNLADDYRGADKKESSDGTGFIIDENGYVVTNYHVVSSTDKIKIVLHDGSEYIAKIIGKDERSDIALLKIDTDIKLPFVQFADSDKVEVGDPVIAIGNPFGFGKTVTSGIVSCKGRNLSNQIAELGAGGDLVYYLQTDAAVNYGNSGGPLFSYDAEVVGMITVFFSDGMHNTGINFAIPSNTLKKVIKELKDHGKMQRSWLGIAVSPLNKKAARVLGLGKQYGCIITRVESNSPAAIAGIQAGDILITLNDESISENTNLEFMLNSLPIGKVIPIQIVRHKVGMKLSVMVGVRSDEDFYLNRDDVSEKKEISYEKIDGIEIGVAELTPELRKSFDISDGINGVMISYVGQRNDIAIGNVILAVNQTNITNIAGLKSELKKLSESSEVTKSKELAFYIFDPQTRKSDYVVMDFNLENDEVNSSKDRSGTISKESQNSNKITDTMEKLKTGLKSKWRLI